MPDSSDKPPINATDAEIRAKMQFIARQVKEQIPPGFCFFVLISPRDGSGNANYVSNGNRDDIVKVMQEFIAKNGPEQWAKHV